MDIKTLPTILCYVSSATTLNTYSHITDEMQQLAAEKIDRDTAKAEVKTTRRAERTFHDKLPSKETMESQSKLKCCKTGPPMEGAHPAG
ncbi:MAG: hypothetical protein ACLR0V_06100 [Roseburia hominis]